MKRFVTVFILLSGLVACRHLGMGTSEHGKLLHREAAEPVGAEMCIACHAEQADALSHTVHAKDVSCESCHGPGSLHVADPPGHIVGPKDLLGMSPRGKAEMCLGCHTKMTFSWAHAQHAKVACWQCHSDVVHFTPRTAEKPPRAFVRGADFCNQCHVADTADFQQVFHHPVPEGKMTCADCHSVHGDGRAVALEPSATCARCHARQAGPKVFRHAALDDGCQVCHAAHGSPVAALLTQQGNSLCLQCHFEAKFPVIMGVDHREHLARGRACYDCHTEIHGSDTDPTLLGRLR